MSKQHSAALTSEASMKDLAPHIHRQRLVIEGTRAVHLSREDIEEYLSALAPRLDMTALTEPVTHRSDRFGWAGWIHWETSGCHVYAWDEDPAFFSVDIYTCKSFAVTDAVAYTNEIWKPEELVFREF